MVRKLAVVTMASVLALGAVACGQTRHDAVVDVDTSVDGASTAQALAQSADQTTGAATGRVHMTMATSVSGLPSSALGSAFSFTMTADGAFDSAADTSSMDIDLGSAITGMLDMMSERMTEAERAEFEGQAASMHEQVVRSGRVAYLKLPAAMSEGSSVGDKWIKVDAGQVQPAAGGSANPFGATGAASDPTAILDFLKGAGADATEVGHETVGGVDTTHLHATVSMQQALDASGTDRSRLEAAAKGLPGVSSALADLTFPVDVYVDGDGLVRRIVMTYDLGGMLGAVAHALDSGESAPDGVGLTMTTTLDFSDFGQPVSIVVPTPDQTVDVCDLDRVTQGQALPPLAC